MDDITLTLTPREAALISEMIRIGTDYADRHPTSTGARMAVELAAVRDRITAAINGTEATDAKHP